MKDTGMQNLENGKCDNNGNTGHASGGSGHGCCHNNCCCGHKSENESYMAVKFAASALSFLMLVAGMVMSAEGCLWFTDSYWVAPVWYVIAFIPVGYPVLKEAFRGVMKRDFFNEFTLMSLACAGAFYIKEWPEAVGVMLFYSVGETLQHLAVDRATRNITEMLDVRSISAAVIRGGRIEKVDPGNVRKGEIIEVSPGQRSALDGTLEDSEALFDTSALTGESVPREIKEGEEVLAGMISLHKTVRVRVEREYKDSTLSRILDMVRDASSRKAQTELFIRKFARIYTPVVITLALLVVLIPAVIGIFDTGFHFVFSDWLYRSLVFLVISCPCALVVSVPLGYFAGVGASSRLGILFKGGNYLEAMASVNTVAFDKTGTLTTGCFKVTEVYSILSDSKEMLGLMAAVEAGSTHPLAKALTDYVYGLGIPVCKADSMSEMAGFGTRAYVDGRHVLVGSQRMLAAEGIEYQSESDMRDGTVIVCAIDGRYAGYVTLSDTLRPDAKDTIDQLRSLGVDEIMLLSGDRKETVGKYASMLGISDARGELLPEDKAAIVDKIASVPSKTIAFVGDGMNDAPVLALSDVGVAMGGYGSDVAIESADVVIQADRLSRLTTAIRIGRVTRAVVIENISGAISIKVLILILGVLGYASLWSAVFADVGVALLAVLNSMRIMWKKYEVRGSGRHQK